jgi:hypothetical protein
MANRQQCTLVRVRPEYGVIKDTKGGNITVVRECGASQPVERVPLVGPEDGCVGYEVSKMRTFINAHYCRSLYGDSRNLNSFTASLLIQ